MDEEAYPQVRAIGDVVAEMNAIAARCETATVDAEAAARMIERGLTLVLELRMPRMPDTPEELAEMMAQADSGISHSSEETFRRLREHSKAFGGFLERFREMIAGGRLESAARCIGPEKVDGAPEWHGSAASLAVEQTGRVTTATIRQDGRMESCISEVSALAVLGAALRCHAAWSDIRR